MVGHVVFCFLVFFGKRKKSLFWKNLTLQKIFNFNTRNCCIYPLLVVGNLLANTAWLGYLCVYAYISLSLFLFRSLSVSFFLPLSFLFSFSLFSASLPLSPSLPASLLRKVSSGYPQASGHLSLPSSWNTVCTTTHYSSKVLFLLLRIKPRAWNIL